MKYPAIRFEAQTLSVLVQLAALQDERLDVGFVRPPVRDPSVASETLMSEPLCVVLSKKHPLAGKTRIELSQLADQPFILIERTRVPVFHDLVLQACRNAGFVPHAPHEADHPYMLSEMVSEGMGVSLLPAWSRKIKNDRVVFRSLGSTAPTLETAVAWRRDNTSVAVKDFLVILRKVMSRTEPVARRRSAERSVD